MNSIGGPDLLIWLVLAFGGAMFVGNLLALVRPPAKQPPKKVQKTTPGKRRGATNGATSGGSSGTSAGQQRRAGADIPVRPTAPPLVKAPRGRTIAMMCVGGVASVWAIATLLSH